MQWIRILSIAPSLLFASNPHLFALTPVHFVVLLPPQGGVQLTFRRLPPTAVPKFSLKSADLTLKKLKQKIASKIKPETLDLLGIRRAVLEGESSEFDAQIANFDDTTNMCATGHDPSHCHPSEPYTRPRSCIAKSLACLSR